MRKTIAPAAVLAAASLVLAGMAPVVWATRTACTITGTNGDDRIFLQSGNDNITYGAQGADLLVGGRGNDQCLHVLDQHASDEVRGGPGRDRYNADPGDSIRSVEIGPTNCEGV